MPLARLLAAVLTLGVGSGALSACGAGSTSDAGTATPGTVAVVASFYPLGYAAEQVGGRHVSVATLTKPGAEPHDVELTAKQVASVSRAQLVVYSRGFQPAVDIAVDQQAAGRAVDVSSAAHLDLPAPAEDADPLHPSGHPPHNDGEGADETDPGSMDPHFWLDPQRYASVASDIAARLSRLDPSHASDYARNLAAFSGRLDTLDAQFATGLRSCRIRDLVTGHAAFGYLSERYGLTQVGISGLSPDAEPSAAKLAEVADFVRDHGVTTVYTETLVEPAFADTVAANTGAMVRTLDPVEGITPASAGADYLQVMRANLATLRAGQDCP